MARFAQLALLLPLFFALLDLAQAKPILDEEMKRVLEGRDASTLKPLHLARRDASGRQPRHLRPEDFMVQKRDITPPDVGQLATWEGDPVPIRDGKGTTFLGPTNHELDKQNPDNLAAPPSDAGESSASEPDFNFFESYCACSFSLRGYQVNENGTPVSRRLDLCGPPSPCTSLFSE